MQTKQLVGSTILEFKVTNGHLLKSVNDHVFSNPKDFLRISVPALLYLLQNTLLYVALSNLAAPVFQVTYQGKLLTTALVSVVLLKRQYNFRQWVCLTTLGLGVATVVLGEAANKGSRRLQESDGSENFSLGMFAVTISCFSSALAGVYFEKVLKKPPSSDKAAPAPPSLWMRNMQLSFFSILIAIANIARTPEEKPFMHGFTSWVWVLVLLQGGGGLLVAAVIKYADNVLKGLATGVAVVVSTVFSILLFGTPLTLQFCFGASIILTSVYFFSNEITCFKKNEGSVEMKPLNQ